MNKSGFDGTLFILPRRLLHICGLNLNRSLDCFAQTKIIQLTQQGIPYIYKGRSWG